MSGTKVGGLLAARTNKINHGEDFYVRIGKLGGQAGTGHSFAHGKVDPSEAGKRGGMRSRRVWTDEERQLHSAKIKTAKKKTLMDRLKARLDV